MFNRGGFPGQRPMGHTMMNQQGMNHPGMNMSGMNMPGMNMAGVNMPAMNQQNMNHPGMNHPGMNHPGMNSGMNSGMNHPHMGHQGMNRPNMGFPGMNQPGMNQPAMGLNRMSHPGMNQGGMGQGFGMRPVDNPGSFGGGNSEQMGMKVMPMRSPMHSSGEGVMGSQALPQRFPGPNVPSRQGQPRMQSQSQEIPSIVNRVLTHSSDHMGGKPKTPLQGPGRHMKEKPWDALSMFGNLGQDMGMKSSSLEQMSNQNRYTNESASSILESFGLSNEDLEELSRYPDDQLTPGNMPSILRDIRLRKMSRPGSTPDQGGGRRPGNEMMQSKVIDYGHSSKFQFNDRSASERSYESSRTEQKPRTASKEPATSSSKKPDKHPENAMDNKIPTISGSRKPMWQPPKPDRSNNKTLVGEQKPVTTSEVNVSKGQKPVITIQTDVPAVSDVPATVHTEMKTAVQVVTGVGKSYQLPAETTPAGKGSWTPALSQEETQKLKRLPTPSMMNDYYAASPRIFPHICSLCNVECRHLKDWIKHQNTTSHIENCRKLRQQYPDWNPHVLSSVRNEDKKDETTPRRSKSNSGSPRRSRRSSSRRRNRKSLSRSPRSSVRTRSRSPRRSRQSPRRSRSPRRGSRSPRRSLSPRRHRRARSRSSPSPDKRAVDAAVQSFIEASKIKSGEKVKPAKVPTNGKKVPPKPTQTNVKSKKPTGSLTPTNKSGGSVKAPGSSTSSVGSSSRKPSSGSNSSVKKPSSVNAPRNPSSSDSTAKKPTSSTSAAKKPVVSTAARKTTSNASSWKKLPPSKPPAGNRKTPNPPKAPVNEPYNPLNKFTNKNNSGKIIHVTNLPDSDYTDQDILKIVQPFGKVCDILIIRSKNEAFLETNFKEAATAAVNYSETTPVMINSQRVNLCLAGQKKRPVKTESKNVRVPHTQAKPSSQTSKMSKDKALKVPPKKSQVVPPGFIKRYKLADPPLMESEKCIILISNLPETPYTVDEISNLAKPFGGVSDILVISTHRKAYLELDSRKSVDSMMKFYSVFPTYLGGNLLNIATAPRYKNLKDQDRIFADIVEQSPYKITPTIYEKFVYLLNVPEKNVSDYDVVCLGIRFGKVEHFIIISNKRKAILHMQSATAAKSMHNFLSRYPCCIGETVLQCALPSKTKLAEDEYMTYLEEYKPSSGTKSSLDETNVASTADEAIQEIKVKQQVSASKDKEDNISSLPCSPISQTEMEVDLPEDKRPSVPQTVLQQSDSKPLTKDVPETVEAPPSVPTKPTPCPPSCGPSPSDSAVQAMEDEDDDDEEEAAEAPEAPDTSPIYFHPEPMIQYKEPNPASQPLLAEELEVLVSVESDEEECEERCPSFLNTNPVMHLLAVIASQKSKQSAVADKMSDNVGRSDCPESADRETAVASQNVISEPLEPKPENLCAKSEDDGYTKSENLFVVEQPSDKAQESSAESPNKEEANVCSTNARNAGKVESSPTKAEENTVKETKSESIFVPSSTEDRPKSPVQTKDDNEPVSAAVEASKETDQAAVTTSVSLTRTAKYNPQKGEISVTLSVDSQKPVVKTGDARKRSSGERGSSGRESSMPKSNSNRSSPTDSTSTNSKSSIGCSQKKSGGKYVCSQQEKDIKARPRSRDRDIRSNTRKDDRSKGNSSSSRYARSFKASVRGPRSNEDEEEPFPFNLDEFVTVDEIVEEHGDTKTKAEGEAQTPQAVGSPRKGKRKETDPVSSDPKKPKGMRSDSQELSFVTLDEVGDEEENTVSSRTTSEPTSRSLVTVDEVHAEAGTPQSVKQSQMLMTLDEISDEDDAPDSTTERPASAVPEVLAKDQLLTLDEVSGEDEEQTSPSVPSNVEPKLVQNTEIKVEDTSGDPKTKDAPVVPEVPQAVSSQGDDAQQHLLTLDEVKGDDDEEFLADMENQFLTVDEVGEEEEESEMKVEETEKSETSPAVTSAPARNKTSSKPSEPSSSPAPSAKRGRPRKRPLPAEENKDSSQQTPADSDNVTEPEKTPTKPKDSKGSTDGAAAEDSTSSTPEKADSGTGKSKSSETPAKKKKLAASPAEKPKLAPFNPNVPIGMEFLIPKTGYFCELCSLFYMDEASKLKHCKSMRHYQAMEKHMANEHASSEGKPSNP
ncbi:zinc finger protein 638 isoform X2 [Mixophyes fleayi]